MRKILTFLFFIVVFTTLSAQDKNLGFEVTSGGSMMDYGHWKEASFCPGDFILTYHNRPLNNVPDEFKGQEVVFYFEVGLGAEIIHRHVYTANGPEYDYWKVNLIPDPWDNISVVFRHDWSGNFLRVLDALPKGKHLLKVSTYLEKEGIRVQTGYGEITYDNSGEYDADLLKMADLIDKNSTFDPEKEMSEWIEKNVGRDEWRKANEAEMANSDAEDAAREAKNNYKVTAKNNCNESFTLTVNDQQTYVIDGKGTVVISIARGRTGTIKRNNVVVATVSEKDEGGVVSICN
jgi:hypothetical protein